MAQQPMSAKSAIIISLDIGSVSGTNAKGSIRRNDSGYSPMDIDIKEVYGQVNMIGFEAVEQSGADVKCFYCRKRGKGDMERLKGQGQSA